MKQVVEATPWNAFLLFSHLLSWSIFNPFSAQACQLETFLTAS